MSLAVCTTGAVCDTDKVFFTLRESVFAENLTAFPAFASAPRCSKAFVFPFGASSSPCFPSSLSSGSAIAAIPARRARVFASSIIAFASSTSATIDARASPSALSLCLISPAMCFSRSFTLILISSSCFILVLPLS